MKRYQRYVALVGSLFDIVAKIVVSASQRARPLYIAVGGNFDDMSIEITGAETAGDAAQNVAVISSFFNAAYVLQPGIAQLFCPGSIAVKIGFNKQDLVVGGRVG